MHTRIKAALILAILSAPITVLANTRTEHEQTVTYRIMAYNVGSAANIPLGPRQINQIAGIVIDNAIDVAGFCEMELGTRWHEGRDHISELCVALANRGYPMHMYKWPASRLQGGWQTPALLCRYPIEEARFDIIPAPGELRWAVGHIVFNIAENTPVQASMTHFWPQGDPKIRDAAVARLANTPNRFSGPRTIMGDFNLAPDSRLYQIVTAQGWRSSCEVLYNRPCPTVQGTASVSGPLPLTGQIDYIFGNDDIEFIDSCVGYYSLSDHWPIIAEVRIKADGPPNSPGLPDMPSDPSAGTSARKRASSLWRAHDYRKAAEAYREWQTLADHPDDAGFAAYSAACMWLHANTPKKAKEAFQYVIEAYPNTEWAARSWYNIGFMNKSADLWADAETAFQQFLTGYYRTIHSDDPKSPMVWMVAREIAQCRSSTGKATEPNLILKELARQNPVGPVARSAAYRLAWQRFTAGKFTEAAPYLMQADPPARGMWPSEAGPIAETYLAAGDFERADRFHECYLHYFTNPLHHRVRAARWDRRRYAERFLIPVKSISGITINADLSEWTDPATIRLTGEAHRYLFDPAGPAQEMASAVWLGWSPDAFYVSVNVTDESHENSFSALELFKGDCLQIAIDPAADATRSYNADDFEIGVALGPKGVETVAFWDQRDRDLSAIQSAVRHQSGHTCYEISIPMSLLTSDGQLPQKMGFNVLVGYARGSKRLGWLDWTPGIGEEKSPVLYPTLLLAD